MRFLCCFALVSLLACGDDDRPMRDGGGTDGMPADGATGDGSADVGVPDVMRSDAPVRDGSSCGAAIDVVFVIDTSTSMTDELDQIANGITSVWNAARSLTTDSQFSLVVFVDDVVAVNGCAPFATVESLQAEFMRWRDFTSTNDQPAGGGTNSNSDCAENSMDALYDAATMCPWRDGATRVIVHATDDTFAERPVQLSSIPVQRSFVEVAGVLVANELRVGSFSAPGMGEFCGAGTSPNVGQGFHEPYLGMDTLSNQTGGRAWSIRDVRAGTLDMAASITELIDDEYCTLF